MKQFKINIINFLPSILFTKTTCSHHNLHSFSKRNSLHGRYRSPTYRRTIGSFGGYAGQQLNRMLNALARDRLEQREKEEHILHCL